MKIINKPIPRLFIMATFAIFIIFGLSSFCGAEVETDDNTKNLSQEEIDDNNVMRILQDINSPDPLPDLVIREKGSEPHERIGYDRPFSTPEQDVSRKIFQYMPDASKSLGTESMLSELSKEVAGKVFYELKEEGHKNLKARVAVVAAVPLSDLKRETEFGRIIAEYYLTDLADRGIRVTELRMGSDINILPQTGEFLLSRNIGEIANNTPALDYVVVTTFTNTRKTLILQGRLVSLKSGLVKTSWRYNLPLNRELLTLFYNTDQQPFTIAVKGIGQ